MRVVEWNFTSLYRGQLNVLLPSASGLRQSCIKQPPAIVHRAVYGTLGSSFDYSTNMHEITVNYQLYIKVWGNFLLASTQALNKQMLQLNHVLWYLTVSVLKEN